MNDKSKQQHTTAEKQNSFLALKIIAGFLAIIGWLCIVIGVLSSIALPVMFYSGQIAIGNVPEFVSYPLLLAGIMFAVCLLVGVTIGVLLLGIAESFQALRVIAINSYK